MHTIPRLSLSRSPALRGLPQGEYALESKSQGNLVLLKEPGTFALHSSADYPRMLESLAKKVELSPCLSPPKPAFPLPPPIALSEGPL